MFQRPEAIKAVQEPAVQTEKVKQAVAREGAMLWHTVAALFCD